MFLPGNAWKNEAAATWLGDETCTPAHATGFRLDGEHLPQLGDDSQSRRWVLLSCEYKGKDRESSPRAMVVPTTALHCVCECSRGFRHGKEGRAISGRTIHNLKQPAKFIPDAVLRLGKDAYILVSLETGLEVSTSDDFGGTMGAKIEC